MAMQTCYGQQIVRARLPAMAQGLLSARDCGARGCAGRLRLRTSRSHGLTIGFDDRR